MHAICELQTESMFSMLSAFWKLVKEKKLMFHDENC